VAGTRRFSSGCRASLKFLAHGAECPFAGKGQGTFCGPAFSVYTLILSISSLGGAADRSVLSALGKVEEVSWNAAPIAHDRAEILKERAEAVDRRTVFKLGDVDHLSSVHVDEQRHVDVSRA
jgi:hypothetical protein